MTLFLKALPYLIGLGALVAIGWAINRWDAGRLERAYDEGVRAERAAWTSARARAVEGAASGAQAGTVASEQASDTARAQGTARSAAVASQTQSTVETITDAYADAPQPVCRPDGAPEPIPPRVLKGLDQARRAALGNP